MLAEHEWLALHDNFGLPVHVFRCGGIYGARAPLYWGLLGRRQALGKQNGR